jgi:hypothetical protein
MGGSADSGVSGVPASMAFAADPSEITVLEHDVGSWHFVLVRN